MYEPTSFFGGMNFKLPPKNYLSIVQPDTENACSAPPISA